MVFNELLWSIRSKVIGELSEQKLDFKISSSSECLPNKVKLLLPRFEQIIGDYEDILKFVDLSKNSGHFIIEDGERRGYYLHAFCCGISAILDEFSSLLCDIEATYLMSSGFSMIYIINKLEYIAVALASIKLAVQKISEKKFSGCSILNLCEHFINCECPVTQKVFIKVHSMCLKPFYLQLKLWIVEANLNSDPFNEFFIKRTSSTSLDQESSSLDCTFDSLHYTTSRILTAPGYQLDPDNLPSIVPFSVATKILFIGESLSMCRRNQVGSEFNDQILQQCGISEETILSQFDEIESENTFNLRKFTLLVDNVWSGLNKYIRKAADDIGNINSQLILMWEIYLLGRGELFQEFLTTGGHLLSADVTMIDSANLNMALRDAVYRVYLTENSELTHRFYFALPPRNALKKGLTVRSQMALRCKVNWPLDYLFTSQVISTYNSLFCFLLRLKNAHIDVNRTWKTTNRIKDRSLRMEFIEMRIHLLAIVGNLQNYCFTNVIANEMNILIEGVKKADMFTDVQKSLSIFLANIMNRLFLTSVRMNIDPETPVASDSDSNSSINNEVYRCFMIIFQLCEKFYHLTEQGGPIELKSLKLEFESTFKKLMTLLQMFDDNYYHTENESSVHLYNLMMCLDYNGFFREQLCMR